ncbi:hypothetical protein K1X84_10510 [bacterium]|nr:hypothetical protein [bacterium]
MKKIILISLINTLLSCSSQEEKVVTQGITDLIKYEIKGNDSLLYAMENIYFLRQEEPVWCIGLVSDKVLDKLNHTFSDNRILLYRYTEMDYDELGTIVLKGTTMKGTLLSIRDIQWKSENEVFLLVGHSFSKQSFAEFQLLLIKSDGIWKTQKIELVSIM